MSWPSFRGAGYPGNIEVTLKTRKRRDVHLGLNSCMEQCLEHKTQVLQDGAAEVLE
jgi:hypothetical protein